MLALAGAASAASSEYIAHAFPARPTPDDLLFRLLPTVRIMEYGTDIALAGAFASLIAYLTTRARDEWPRAIAVFSAMYIVRAGMMVLTPLASAHGNGTRFGFLPLVQNGMYPSGHTAAALLCVLLVDRKRTPVLRATALACACVVWVGLVLARAHYSIDIAGGLLLGYFVWREWTSGSAPSALKRLLGSR
jgi:membrane-associated phospholipid phosphatase